MDFNWFFRRGPNHPQRPDVFSDEEGHGFGHNQRDEEVRSFEFPFMDPFENIEDTSHDIFKHMDDMLSQMFTSHFTPFGSIKFEDNIPKETDPRSLMLKDPQCKSCEQYPVVESFEAKKPSQFVDSDIDDEVAKHGLVLDDRAPQFSKPKTFSYQKFSSVKSVHLSDGTLEEHRKVTDSQGNVTTTIRRSIGDQSYEITTRTDGQGIREKQENLTNIDENELSDFEKRWQDLKSRKGRLQESNSESLVPKLTPSAGDPSYVSLFKKFFGL